MTPIDSPGFECVGKCACELLANPTVKVFSASTYLRFNCTKRILVTCSRCGHWSAAGNGSLSDLTKAEVAEVSTHENFAEARQFIRDVFDKRWWG